MTENDDKGKYDIKKTHDRDQLLRDGADALDAAEEDDADERRDGDAEDEVQQRPLTLGCRDERVDRVIQRADDGVDLRHVADAERSDACKYAEQNAEPLPVLSETVLDIVHRAADPVALGVTLAEANGKRDLGILDDHAEQRRQPQPEHRAVAAERDRLRRAHDVARADRCRQRRGDRLKRRDRAFARRLPGEHLAERVLYDIAEFGELDASVANGQVQTAEDGAWQKDVQPRHRVETAGEKVDEFLHRFIPFSVN